MTDDGPEGADGIGREEFGRRLRERSPAERRRFVADLWAAGGWETAVEGPFVRLTRAGDPPAGRRVLVPETDAAPVDVLRCDADAGEEGTRLGPADLYRRARYGLDRPTADDLFRRHFGRPMAAAPTAETDGRAGDEPAPDGTAESAAGDEAGDRSLRALALGAGVGAAAALLVIAAAVGLGVGPAVSGEPSLAGPATGGDGGIASRYVGLGPTCERPPGVVVAIQVGALKHDDPATNAGIRTAWRFAAPSFRRATGSVEAFVGIMTREPYARLVNHDRGVLGPVERTGSEIGRDEDVEEVSRTVVAFDRAGDPSAFEFTLVEQEGGERDGCWMTVSITDVPVDRAGLAAARASVRPTR